MLNLLYFNSICLTNIHAADWKEPNRLYVHNAHLPQIVPNPIPISHIHLCIHILLPINQIHFTLPPHHAGRNTSQRLTFIYIIWHINLSLFQGIYTKYVRVLELSPLFQSRLLYCKSKEVYITLTLSPFHPMFWRECYSSAADKLYNVYILRVAYTHLLVKEVYLVAYVLHISDFVSGGLIHTDKAMSVKVSNAYMCMCVCLWQGAFILLVHRDIMYAKTFIKCVIKHHLFLRCAQNTFFFFKSLESTERGIDYRSFGKLYSSLLWIFFLLRKRAEMLSCAYYLLEIYSQMLSMLRYWDTSEIV